MGCLRSATTARRPDGNFRNAAVHTECGTEKMLTNVPTWTTDRVELLKSHFEAGLTCREIAASIGVSRNAVIGKLARLEMTRAPARLPASAPGNPSPDCSIRSCRPSTKTHSRFRKSRSQARIVARCSNSATNAAAGRSARPALRISVFAAIRRCTACPIAPGIPASPTVRAHASAWCADKATGSREENASTQEPRF